MICECGQRLCMPGIFLGQTALLVPIVQFQCPAGHVTRVSLETMRPYNALRSEVFPAPRGQYKTCADGPVFTCPLCPQGLIPLKLPVHTVHADGRVTPSVICPQGCGFHAYVTLSDWRPLRLDGEPLTLEDHHG